MPPFDFQTVRARRIPYDDRQYLDVAHRRTLGGADHLDEFLALERGVLDDDGDARPTRTLTLPHDPTLGRALAAALQEIYPMTPTPALALSTHLEDVRDRPILGRPPVHAGDPHSVQFIRAGGGTQIIVVLATGRGNKGRTMPLSVSTVADLLARCRTMGYENHRPFVGSEGHTIEDAQWYDGVRHVLEHALAHDETRTAILQGRYDDVVRERAAHLQEVR